MTQSKKQEERHLRIIHDLLKRPENKKCFDCPAKGPVYVNLLNYSFICARCSGLHRNLSHRVKSISASTFTPAEMDALKRGGNAKAAEFWLAKYTPADFPEPAVDDVDGITQFMRMKYVNKRWTLAQAPPAQAPPADGQKVVSKDSFDRGPIVINPPALSHRSSSLSSSSTISRQSSAADVRVSERSVSYGGENGESVVGSRRDFDDATHVVGKHFKSFTDPGWNAGRGSSTTTPASTRTVSPTSPTFAIKRDTPSSDALSSRLQNKSEVEDIFSSFTNHTSNSQPSSQASPSQPVQQLQLRSSTVPGVSVAAPRRQQSSPRPQSGLYQDINLNNNRRTTNLVSSNRPMSVMNPYSISSDSSTAPNNSSMTNLTSYNDQQTVFNNLQQPVNSTNPFATTSSSVSSPSAITDPYKAFERLSISDSASQATVVNNTPITNQTGITANQQVSSPFDSMQKTQHSANPYDALYNNNSIFDVFQSASVQKTKDIVVDSGFDAFQSASTQSPQVTSPQVTSPQSLDNLFDSYQSAQPPALQRTASDGIFNSFQSAPTNAIQRSTSSLSNDIFDPFQSASTTSLQKSASSSSSSSNNIFSSSQSLQTTSLQRTMSSEIFTSFQQAPESSILGNGSSTNVFNTLQSAPNLTHQQPALSSGTTNSYNTFATRQQWPYQSAQHQDIKYQNTGINFTTSSNNMNNTDPFSPFEIFQQPKTEISAGQTSNLPSISQQQTSANYQTSVNPFVSTPTNGTGMQQSSHFSGTSTAYGSHNPFPLASNSVNVNGSLNNLQHTGSKLSFDAAFEDLDPLNNNKKKGFVGSEVNGGTRDLFF